MHLQDRQGERAVEPFHLARLPVGEGHLDRILNHHVAVRPCVKVLTHTPFKKLDIHQLVTLGNTDLLAEHFQCLCGITSSPDTAKRRHTWVVPPAYEAFLDEFKKLTLAHEGICKVQSGKFILV